MNRYGELMSLFLQETEEEEEETERNKTTIVDLLTERTMDGSGDRVRRRRSLQERLGLKSIVCCGSTWRFGASAVNTQPDSDEDENANVVESVHHQQMDVIDVNLTPAECTVRSPRMNLAAALAAEREFRAAVEGGDESVTEEGRPLKRLLEEGEDEELGLGRDQVCCVCMGRMKGAALIPCGHTYCRVCCRELWLNRGTCPLCNRSILEILHIY